jgi:hypothetical protein
MIGGRAAMVRWTDLNRRKRRTSSVPDLNGAGKLVFAKRCNPRILAETIFWCSQQPLVTTSNDPEYLRNRHLLEERMSSQVDFKSLRPLSAQLRSPLLQPATSIGEYIPENERRAAIDHVISKRAELIAVNPSFDQDRVLREKKGRVLNYYPSENLADGAAEVGSLGFFDVENAPPWDTWIEYSDGRLACWVPEPLIQLAEAGIDANPEECIQWAD